MAKPLQSSRTLGDLIGDTPHDHAKRIARNTVLWGKIDFGVHEVTLRVHDDDVLRLTGGVGKYSRMQLRAPTATKLTCDRLNTFGPVDGRFELREGVIYYTEPDGQNVHPLGDEWAEYPYMRCKLEDRL